MIRKRMPERKSKCTFMVLDEMLLTFAEVDTACDFVEGVNPQLPTQ
jgi:hypothetical protein